MYLLKFLFLVSLDLVNMRQSLPSSSFTQKQGTQKNNQINSFRWQFLWRSNAVVSERPLWRSDIWRCSLKKEQFKEISFACLRISKGWETEAGKSLQVRGQPGLHWAQGSLNYTVRSCLKKAEQTNPNSKSQDSEENGSRVTWVAGSTWAVLEQLCPAQ